MQMGSVVELHAPPACQLSTQLGVVGHPPLLLLPDYFVSIFLCFCASSASDHANITIAEAPKGPSPSACILWQLLLASRIAAKAEAGHLLTSALGIMKERIPIT
jgi:hypothetical protein